MNAVIAVVTTWRYKNRRLANPVVIIWRLIFYPLLALSVLITCLIASIGWGLDSGKEIWKSIF